MANEQAAVYVIRDVLHITAEEILELLNQWKVCKNDIGKFLRTRAVPPELFFARMDDLKMMADYYDARAEWMAACDRELVQKAIVVAMNALDQGSETMAQWVLSRRCGILFGSPDEQDRILTKVRNGCHPGADNLDPQNLGIKLLPLDRNS
jgi:hypothetical protein